MRNFRPRKQEDDQTSSWYTPLPIECGWGVYARQSTLIQVVKNTQSTEMQTNDLIAWLRDRGVGEKRIALFDADLGTSGRLRIDQRTGLQELVDRIQADEIKAVLVYQVSRLFRDETGVQYNVFANICKEHRCVLVTSDGMVFNFNNPMHLKMFRYLAEMAAEYIPQQIGLLHAARLRKARKGMYAGMGTVSTGYIVDYRKGSPTQYKFIPYKPHAEVVFSLYKRYYALCGDFSQLWRELLDLPYVFPPFEAGIDYRNLSRWHHRALPAGGYDLSRSGLELLLTNPAYLGWWIVKGDIVNTSNHERIIDEEHEYLFWYAFNRLSDYTVEGKVNEMRGEEPRRFYQRHTNDHTALLKDRIASPLGLAYVHVFEGKTNYAVIPKPTSTKLKIRAYEVEARLIDAEFTTRFFHLLRETRDFDIYRKWLAEETERRVAIQVSVTEQLTEIDSQQEAIVDEIVAIRKQINAIKDEAEKATAEAEAQPILEGLRKRSANLEKLKADLTKKLPTPEENEELRRAREYEDFQTELEKLVPAWDKKPISVRKEFVNLFVKEAVLTFAAPHYIQLDITWALPAWGCDRLYIYRKRGKAPFWTDAEHEILRTLYPLATRDEILEALSTKSWNSIRAEALNRGVQRMVNVYQQPPTIPQFLTWADWQYMQEHGLLYSDRSTKCESTSHGERRTARGSLILHDANRGGLQKLWLAPGPRLR